ncbi:unnamed protein product [Heterobilharzia americana]|nr:unnamed protein product [Heterobilharzia americana]
MLILCSPYLIDSANSLCYALMSWVEEVYFDHSILVSKEKRQEISMAIDYKDLLSVQNFGVYQQLTFLVAKLME